MSQNSSRISGALECSGDLTVGGGITGGAGLTLTPLGANPGGANTIWINSGDGNNLYKGSSVIGSGGGGGTTSNTITATLRDSNASPGDILTLTNGSSGFGLYESKVSWLIRAGGSGSDIPYGIAVDSSGNLYLAGSFSSSATFGTTTLTSAGGSDVFVAKLSPSGTWLWAVGGGGTGSDIAYSIALDSSGNSYITGSFGGTATFGTTALTSAGGTDVFVAKADTNGNWLWAVRGGGSVADVAYGIAVDSSGNSYITGSFTTSATFGTTTLTSSGTNPEVFVAKLDTNGNWLWAVSGGSSLSSDIGYGIDVDTSGNAYVVGTYGNASVTFGTITLAPYGSVENIFVAKLDTNGIWLWAVRAGGSSGSNIGRAISVDSSGNPYITGNFGATATFGTTLLTATTATDIFAAKLDTNGTWLWAVRAGGSSTDEIGYGIAVDSAGSAYITGTFGNNFLSAQFGTTVLTSNGSYDIFVAKLDTNGNWLSAFRLGGSGTDYGRGICVDSSGMFYLAGYFTGTITYGSTTIISSGIDILVMKGSVYPQTIVIASQSGSIGGSIDALLSGLANYFTGLIPGEFYYYNPPNKTLTTVITQYKLGYAMSSSSLLFQPEPRYLL